jgi:peptidoglycan/xylan/chitin deacetylase (PgdA/CDA1 family)
MPEMSYTNWPAASRDLWRQPQMHGGPANAQLLVTTSWDDGHPSDLRVADLLEKHGLKGTFYLPCTNSEGRPVMSSTEVAELGRRFEIGGHTKDHLSLTELSHHLAAGQILANKCSLEDILGHEVFGFAYVRGRYNRLVRDLVRKAGYRYARTAKSLVSTPGFDRFQVPTTLQFFGHSKSVYFRNFLSQGPRFRRLAILAAVLAHDELATRALQVVGVCTRLGGHFHLWGHSWELDDHDLWGELDRLLNRLSKLNARFVDNSAWCASLTAGAEAQAANITNPVCREPDRSLSSVHRTSGGMSC